MPCSQQRRCSGPGSCRAGVWQCCDPRPGQVTAVSRRRERQAWHACQRGSGQPCRYPQHQFSRPGGRWHRPHAQQGAAEPCGIAEGLDGCGFSSRFRPCCRVSSPLQWYQQGPARQRCAAWRSRVPPTPCGRCQRERSCNWCDGNGASGGCAAGAGAGHAAASHGQHSRHRSCRGWRGPGARRRWQRKRQRHALPHSASHRLQPQHRQRCVRRQPGQCQHGSRPRWRSNLCPHSDGHAWPPCRRQRTQTLWPGGFRARTASPPHCCQATAGAAGGRYQFAAATRRERGALCIHRPRCGPANARRRRQQRRHSSRHKQQQRRPQHDVC